MVFFFQYLNTNIRNLSAILYIDENSFFVDVTLCHMVNFLRQCSGPILNVQEVPRRRLDILTLTLCCLKMSGFSYPVTQWHILQELNAQLHHCRSLKLMLHVVILHCTVDTGLFSQIFQVHSFSVCTLCRSITSEYMFFFQLIAFHKCPKTMVCVPVPPAQLLVTATQLHCCLLCLHTQRSCLPMLSNTINLLACSTKYSLTQSSLLKI